MKEIIEQIIIKIIFAIIVATVTWLTVKRWESDKSLEVLIIVAIATVLSGYFADIIFEKFSDPKAKVTLKSGENKFSIIVVSTKPVTLLDVDLPIFGEVTKTYDFTEAGNVRISRVLNHKSTFIINGRESYQSFIQIHIEDLLPNKDSRYVMEIKPIDKDITSLPATDNYKVSYQWDFNGNRKAKTNWFSVRNGKIVKEPKVWQGLYKVYN